LQLNMGFNPYSVAFVCLYYLLITEVQPI